MPYLFSHDTGSCFLNRLKIAGCCPQILFCVSVDAVFVFTMPSPSTLCYTISPGFTVLIGFLSGDFDKPNCLLPLSIELGNGGRGWKGAPQHFLWHRRPALMIVSRPLQFLLNYDGCSLNAFANKIIQQ